MGVRLAEYDYMPLSEAAVCLEQPKWRRLKAQRELRTEQYAIVAKLHHLGGGRTDNWACYHTEEGLGVDRYIRDCLRTGRGIRRGELWWQQPMGWRGTLKDWIPERRCDDAFARDAAGDTIHHNDPLAVRWCFAGWIAHLCQDDSESRKLLDHVWSSLPERTRAIVERIWRDRVSAKDRKRIESHPLGYWWYLAPHLAARFLGVPYRRANCLPPLQLNPPVTFRYV